MPIRRLVLLVLVGALGVLLLTPLAPASAGRSKSGVPVDDRVSHSACTLLGRAWSDGTETNSEGTTLPVGCRTNACLSPAAHPKETVNAEVCLIGNHGYGDEIDSHRCQALHRVWMRLLNYCASEPDRDVGLVVNAPQCKAPYTTYLLHTEKEGAYDECLKPFRVKELQKYADSKHRPLEAVASERSEVLCGYRPAHRFVDGVCRKLPKGATLPAGGIVMVGDSVTWRAENELTAQNPSWDVDGIPGRHVGIIDNRVRYYLRGHTDPTGLIIALGANPSPGFKAQDFLDAIDDAGNPKTVLMVLPYRYSTYPDVRKAVIRVQKKMLVVAKKRDNVCLVDWPGFIGKHPKIMGDEVHPTSGGEKVYAKLVSQNWAKCVKKTSQPDGGGSGDGGGDDGGDGDGGGGIIPGLPPIPLPLLGDILS